MPEELFVQYCSPTLAGVKTANLFTTENTNQKDLLKQIAEMNERLNPRDLHVMVLGYTRKNRALIYVYRKSRLCKDLEDPAIIEILNESGYDSHSVGKCLTTLIHRLYNQKQFPHEIGCFLGYPAEDVRGFIEDCKPCKCYGVWKVYGDTKKAKQLFAMYDRCTAAYLTQFHQGASLEFLTVRV